MEKVIKGRKYEACVSWVGDKSANERDVKTTMGRKVWSLGVGDNRVTKIGDKDVSDDDDKVGDNGVNTRNLRWFY